MKKRMVLILFSVLFIWGCSLQIKPNEGERVEVFDSVSDFLIGKTNGKNYYAKIKNKEDDNIKISSIYHLETQKPFDEFELAWAIRYKNIEYVNMSFADKYENSNIYIKLDIVGNICTFFIDSNTSATVKSGGNNYYGLGLTGYLLKESNKWGNNWTDKNGKKSKILTINTQIINPRTNKRYRTNILRLLNKKNFNKQLNTKFTKEEIKEFSFEDVIEIIEKANIPDK